eukprot:GHRR01016843.1.p1 GENE.GHRR01016843.1~~GHRR01016843.1.p1  ORF type:complete len:184 (+),score=46.19 GHRR01016843.1:335-886(+)
MLGQKLHAACSQGLAQQTPLLRTFNRSSMHCLSQPQAIYVRPAAVAAAICVNPSHGQRQQGAPCVCRATAPHAEPGMTTLGFCGIGIMGLPMAQNLIKAGYKVVVWNRNSSKCDPLKAAGAEVAPTPAEVAEKSSITFAMLSDPPAALEVATGPHGVVAGDWGTIGGGTWTCTTRYRSAGDLA